MNFQSASQTGKISSAGVETYKLQNNKQGLARVQQMAYTVTWWKYSHQSRVLLLGTGEAGLWLQVKLSFISIKHVPRSS